MSVMSTKPAMVSAAAATAISKDNSKGRSGLARAVAVKRLLFGPLRF